MYTNIGRKIKTLAKTIAVIGIIASVAMGILIITAGSRIGGYSEAGWYGTTGATGGLVTMALGALSSWVGSFVLYGFGELIENSRQIKDDLSQMKERPGVKNS